MAAQQDPSGGLAEGGWPRIAGDVGLARPGAASLRRASWPDPTLTRYVTAEVGRQIAAANENGQSIVRKDAEKIGAAARTLVGMVKHQVAETGAEKLGTPGETSVRVRVRVRVRVI